MIEMQKLNETMKQEESFDAKLDQDLQDVQDQVKLYNEIHARLQWETNEILMKKKFLNNEIQNFKGNIRVHVRLRDFLDGENKADYVHVDGYKNINLQVPQKYLRSSNSQNVYNFKFEHIYDKGTSQSHIFDEISPLVQSICDGYNACIFAYGQTGGGKTHTLIGGESEESKGVLPRSIDIIFERVDFMVKSGWECKVRASFTELYMDSLFDLLDDSENGKRRALGEMREVEIGDKEQLNRYVELARRNRTTGATQSNSQSSRSHAIFQIKLEARKVKKKAMLVSSGCLNIIDLAGSERLNLSQVQGSMKNETICINKSLMALSKVIISLSKRGSHIPYRNSKLTFLLKDYLGKNSKTMVIVALNPCIESFGLTLGSLKFANNLKRIEFGQPVRKNFRVTAKKFRKETAQTGRRNFSARKGRGESGVQGSLDGRRVNKHYRGNSRQGYSTRGSPGKGQNRQRRFNQSQSVIHSRQEPANRSFQTPKSKKMAVSFVDPSLNLTDQEVLIKSGYKEEDIRHMSGTQMSAIVVRERNRMKNLAYKKASNQLKEYAGIPRPQGNHIRPSLNLLPSDEKEVKPQIDLLKQTYDKRAHLTPMPVSRRAEIRPQLQLLPQAQPVPVLPRAKEQFYSNQVKYGTDEKDEQKRVERYAEDGSGSKNFSGNKQLTPKFLDSYNQGGRHENFSGHKDLGVGASQIRQNPGHGGDPVMPQARGSFVKPVQSQISPSYVQSNQGHVNPSPNPIQNRQPQPQVKPHVQPHIRPQVQPHQAQTHVQPHVQPQAHPINTPLQKPPTQLAPLNNPTQTHSPQIQAHPNPNLINPVQAQPQPKSASPQANPAIAQAAKPQPQFDPNTRYPPNQANQAPPNPNYTPQRHHSQYKDQDYQNNRNQYQRNNYSHGNNRRYQDNRYGSRNPERSYDNNRRYDNRSRGYQNHNDQRRNSRGYHNSNSSRGGYNNNGYGSRDRGGYNNYNKGYNRNHNDGYQKNFQHPQDQRQNTQRRGDGRNQSNNNFDDYSASQNFN